METSHHSLRGSMVIHSHVCVPMCMYTFDHINIHAWGMGSKDNFISLHFSSVGHRCVFNSSISVMASSELTRTCLKGLSPGTETAPLF